MENKLHIRPATEADNSLILRFIRELADYEGLLHEVQADEKTLYHSLFERRAAEVIIAEEDSVPVGFALFFHNFSTFLGKPGIYLEDLYVNPSCRGKGYGTQLLAYLAHLAVDRDCGRLEWWCLDENTPSINFYKAMGAQPMDEWTVFRLEDGTLQGMAGRYKR